MEDTEQEIFREARVGERVDFEYEETDNRSFKVSHKDDIESDKNIESSDDAGDEDKDKVLSSGLHIRDVLTALIFVVFLTGMIFAAYFLNRKSESYEYRAKNDTESVLTSSEGDKESNPAADDKDFLELTDGEFYQIEYGKSFVTKSETAGEGKSDTLYAEKNNMEGVKITNSSGYVLAECDLVIDSYIYSYEEYLYYIIEYLESGTLETTTAIIQRRQDDTKVTGKLIVSGSLDTSWNGISVKYWQSDFFYTRNVVNIITLECSQVTEEVPYTLTKDILAATSMDDAASGHMDCLMLSGTEVSIVNIQADDQDNRYYKLSVQGLAVSYWVLASYLEGDEQLDELIAYFDASSGNDELARHIVFSDSCDLESVTLETQSNGCVGIIYIDEVPYVVVETLEAKYSYGYVTELYYVCAVYTFLGGTCQKILADGYEEEDGWLPLRLLDQKESLYDSSLNYSPDCDFDENAPVENFSDRQIQIRNVSYELRKESIDDGEYYESLVMINSPSESTSENESESMSEDGLNEYFLRCLDPEKDSYLSSLDYKTEPSDILTVSGVYTGSFTDAAADEYLVIFKFRNKPEDGYGDDLTIMAVYNNENIICQTSLDADSNAIFVLADGDGRSRVLVFSDSYNLLGFCSQTQWFYTANSFGFTEEDPLTNIRGNIYAGEDSLEHYSIYCKQDEPDFTFGVYQQTETYNTGGGVERSYRFEYTMIYNEAENCFLFDYLGIK